MFSSGSGDDDDAPQNIIKDSRLVSKELISATNSSFRVYYGVASGAVPFLWESEPGTPKHAMATTALPAPINPPPSYHFNSAKKNNKSFAKSSKRSTLVQAILPRLALIRKPRTPASVNSSSSVGSAWEEEENIEEGGRMSPNSTLCFGHRLCSLVTGHASSA